MSDRFVLDVFARVAALSPDVVVYTGDFTSYSDEVCIHTPRASTRIRRVGASGPSASLATTITGRLGPTPRWPRCLTAQLQAAGIRILAQRCRGGGRSADRRHGRTVGASFRSRPDVGRARSRSRGHSCSATTLTPSIARDGRDIAAGFSAAIRTAASANRRFCHRRSCRSRTGDTRQACSISTATACCISAAGSEHLLQGTDQRATRGDGIRADVDGARLRRVWGGSRLRISATAAQRRLRSNR